MCLDDHHKNVFWIDSILLLRTHWYEFQTTPRTTQQYSSLDLASEQCRIFSAFIEYLFFSSALDEPQHLPRLYCCDRQMLIANRKCFFLCYFEYFSSLITCVSVFYTRELINIIISIIHEMVFIIYLFRLSARPPTCLLALLFIVLNNLKTRKKTITFFAVACIYFLFFNQLLQSMKCRLLILFHRSS